MQTVNVPVNLIDAEINNRTDWRDPETLALAAHIAEHGLMYPPRVRAKANGRYMLIDGERRTRAMRDILGWAAIDVTIVEADDEAAYTQMLAANMNRVDPGPMDEARGIAFGMEHYGWSISEAAKRVGRNTRYTADRLALLALCPEAQELAASGQMTPAYALILALAAQQGLERNLQNVALSVLLAAPAPTLVWFRAIVSELVSKQGQQGFNWGEYAEVKTAEVTARLPHPSTDKAPVVGDDTATILGNQAEYWEQVAGQYEARDNKQGARDCRTFARGIRQALAGTVAPSVLTVALTGRCGRQVCACGAQATQEIARAVPRAGGTRIVVERVCSAHVG